MLPDLFAGVTAPLCHGPRPCRAIKPPKVQPASSTREWQFWAK
jgi:hypothetical protein